MLEVLSNKHQLIKPKPRSHFLYAMPNRKQRVAFLLVKGFLKENKMTMLLKLNK